MKINDTQTCAFCYPREQGTHGPVKREWSPEWEQFIPVCRKHALADGMERDGINAPYTTEDGIINDD